MASTPRRVGGRTLITLDPDQPMWVLLARESTDRERQLDNQFADLRDVVGRIDREIPENAVSAFKRQRVELPDGTCGYRVMRPEWEKILTALRDKNGKPTKKPTSVLWEELPFRLLDDPFDLASYPLMFPISTLTMRCSRTCNMFAPLRRGTENVAIVGGMLSLMPTGVFQPASITPTHDSAENYVFDDVTIERLLSTEAIAPSGAACLRAPCDTASTSISMVLK